MAIEGIGDLFSNIGKIEPDTIKLLHDRERMGIESQRNKALEDYYKSLMGQTSARMRIEQQKLNQPVYLGPGMFEAGKGGAPAVQVTPFAPKEPKVPSYAERADLKLQEDARKAKLIADEPTGTYAQKKSQIEALNPHLNPDQFLEKPTTEPKPTYTDQLVINKLKGDLKRDPTPAEILAEKAKVEESKWSGGEDRFSNWTEEQKQMQFIRNFYSGKTPKFMYRDKNSINAYNREYNQWMINAGLNPLDEITARTDITGRQRAVATLTQREGLISSYVDRIELNAQAIQRIQAKYDRNEFGRLFNTAQNWVVRWFVPSNPDAPYKSPGGTGDFEALTLALWSTSQEIAKVESGQLGIAAPSVDAAREMSKIHDANLNKEDLDVVLNASLWLGRTSMEAIRYSKATMLQGIGQVPLHPGIPQPLTLPPQPGVGDITDTDKKKILSLPKFKSAPDGSPITFNGKQIGIKRGNDIIPANTPITSPPSPSRDVRPSSQPPLPSVITPSSTPGTMDPEAVRIHKLRIVGMNKHNPQHPMPPSPNETPEMSLVRRAINEGWTLRQFDDAIQSLLSQQRVTMGAR